MGDIKMYARGEECMYSLMTLACYSDKISDVVGWLQGATDEGVRKLNQK